MLYEVITTVGTKVKSLSFYGVINTFTCDSHGIKTQIINNIQDLYSLVITSYSIHYTKLYDQRFRNHPRNKWKARKAARKEKTLAGRLVRELERIV